MHRIAQRIENRPIMFGNLRIQFPDIRRRNLDKFSERPVLINPDNPQVLANVRLPQPALTTMSAIHVRSEEHTSELQSPCNLVCRLLLEKKKKNTNNPSSRCIASNTIF